MLEIIQNNLIEILMTMLIGLATFIGTKVKKVYEDKVNTETKEKVVKTCVKAVEQLYKDLKGQEKLNKAKENIVLMLNEKGLKITELEMDMMIEEVVNSFNKGVKNEI